MGSAKGRLVRQDGSTSQVQVTKYSLMGCQIPHELPVGELVSVEFTDIALLIGQVSAAQSGQSQISFLGHAPR